MQTPIYSLEEARTRETFLALMWSISHPGRAYALPVDARAAFATIGETLLDLETSYYTPDFDLSGGFARLCARSLPPERAQYHFYPELTHRHLATIESDAHLASWLRRVVTHRAIDAVRERKRRPVTSLDAVAEPVTAATAERDPMLVSWLRGQVAALPAAARAVVVLRYQRELGPVEIAETLDMPLNTVKSHLKRSLAVLRARCARVRHG